MPNASSSRQPIPRWARLFAIFVAGVVALGLVLASLIPSSAELAARAGAELETRLGVKTSVGAVTWRIFPAPSLVLTDIRIEQPEPITLARVTAHPKLGALMQRRLQLNTLEVDGAIVPQLSVRGLGGAQRTPVDPAALPVGRVIVKNLTWINRRGLALLYELEADFDPGWRPRVALLRRPDAETLTQLTLKRMGEQDRWETVVQVGGGTAPGQLNLQTSPEGRLQLTGEFAPQGVDVVAAMTAFKRRAFVAGQANGQTTLSAQGLTLGELASSLQTRTQFRMAPATLLRFDLDRAIKSLGTEKEGQTRLDTLTGQLATRNTPQGMLVRYTDVKARSGAFSAIGEAALVNRRIEGEFSVDLVEGLVGVPLTVSGTLDKPQFSVPKSAVAGAVAGTAVLPGIGTAIGARIGAAIGKLFGDDDGPRRPTVESETLKR